jgi:hypothetical protein
MACPAGSNPKMIAAVTLTSAVQFIEIPYRLVKSRDVAPGPIQSR